MVIFNIIQIVILTLLGLATLYFLIFSVAGVFYNEKKYSDNGKTKKIAVFIPGYKEDSVIVEIAKKALEQDYPSQFFDVIVIADSFQEKTLKSLKELPIKLIEVSFKKSTKSKALNKAMDILKEQYEIAIVLDADNIMEKTFLKKMNAAFENDYYAVQGHRTAKNLNNSWAILDAVSEEINNNIFRRGHRVLGLSSAIIGSGVAFKYDYFKSLMAKAKAVGGFDKELELMMLKKGHKIMYLHNAMVYDEKVQKPEVFQNQRRRWLAAQFHYFKQGLLSSIRDLFLKGNVDYFLKIIQFGQPPRVLLLGAILGFTPLFLIVNFLLQNQLSYSINWIVICATCVLAFVLSIPKKFYNSGTLRALVSLPKGIVLMLLSLLKIKGANKTFIHTQHDTVAENMVKK
ncbi:MAG: glycosyltransferase [Jejuia sp.]